MSFDYSKLRGRIKEKYGTQAEFAAALSISAASLSDKLNEKSDFSNSEAIISCKLLEIPIEKISDYFFVEKVK